MDALLASTALFSDHPCMVFGVPSQRYVQILHALRAQSGCDGGHSNRQCAEDRNIWRPQEQS